MKSITMRSTKKEILAYAKGLAEQVEAQERDLANAATVESALRKDLSDVTQMADAYSAEKDELSSRVEEQRSQLKATKRNLEAARRQAQEEKERATRHKREKVELEAQVRDVTEERDASDAKLKEVNTSMVSLQKERNRFGQLADTFEAELVHTRIILVIVGIFSAVVLAFNPTFKKIVKGLWDKTITLIIGG